ncbi:MULTISPECIES: MFS transporter [Micromonospora]|uniref:MFS transporter n=1 Tax=Micromonospora TaxID=1873 RepID=UPI001EE8A867|nr:MULTISPECIES: MFS transporter [Micromonospora]MCG5449736.1 MFS transporter [Micromonospora hortensis]MCX5121882.1 MFS transporter [Micromonospora sp. NBC_00362]WTI06202.1 MFS transporter [Micromonospora sp. NBC_00821]
MDNSTSAPANDLAGRKEWIGLAVLALPAMLVAMDIGALFLALPHLSADLGVTSVEQLWIIDIYGFLLAGFLLTMGTLGDRVGRRRLLMIGAVAFTVASVLAAYANSGTTLIIARALLGIAGATLSPSTLALITNMFRNEKQRGVAISIWASALFGGTAIGPIVGGVMVEHFWWGSVFLLGVPFMIVLLATGFVLLPEYRDPNAGKFDLFSVVLSLGAILPVVYGVKEFAASDSDNPAVAGGAILFGLVVGWIFIRRQSRLEHPLIDLTMFRNAAFSGTLVTMMFASAALAGVSLMSTQYIQSVEGLSPGASGLWQAPTGLGIAIGSMATPMLMKTLKPATAIMIGLGISLVAMLVLTQAGSSGWLIAIVVAVALVALGTGPLFTQGTGMVVSSVAPEKAGSAASLSETSNVFGSTLGLALLGSIGAAVYRDRMADAPLTDVPPEVADVSRENVAAATAASDSLPGNLATALSDVAGEAFTTAMNVVAGVEALLVIALIVLVAVTLRNKPAAQASGSDPTAPSAPASSPASASSSETVPTTGAV